jgi:hypothetical protein
MWCTSDVNLICARNGLEASLCAASIVHADVLCAIGLAPTSDGSRWRLLLGGIARCPLDARHPLAIIAFFIRPVRLRQQLGLVIVVIIALLRQAVTMRAGASGQSGALV